MRNPASVRAGVLALLLVTACFVSTGVARAAERMAAFEAEYRIQPDGTVAVTETITWDFGGAERHGIFRDIVNRQACGTEPPPAEGEARVYSCPAGSDRVYRVTNIAVSSPSGAAAQFEASQAGDALRIRIGDPDETVSGRQTYVIHYRLEGALDRYPSHDELYWNVLGKWEVAIDSVEVRVSLPRSTEVEAACYEGPRGSTEPCVAVPDAGTPARFTATHPLVPGDQVTIVLGWPRGLVDVEAPITEDRTSIDDFFALDALEFGGAILAAIVSVGGVILLWWRHGRDRRYRTPYYLTQDPSEHTAPLFAHRPVVVEYLPPDDLRPAQMGVILDERADTRDVTATIIDLAVRGYLHITEIPGKGLLGKTDWELEQLRETDDALLLYEDELHRSLFRGRETGRVKISDLKTHFADDLAKVKSKLYDDAVKRKWFAGNPESRRNLWALAALVLTAAGVGLTVLAGIVLGRALIGVPVVAAGLIFLVLSRAMGRRTATGSEALRRTLGFRLYVATAETRRQEFNEKQGIFARYLPYAIVFGCVDRWAKAFEGVDDPAMNGTAAWYTGVGAFHVASFSSGLNNFSSSVSSAISSSPASSGSGFSGGFSGGGGGGGGGGSW